MSQKFNTTVSTIQNQTKDQLHTTDIGKNDMVQICLQPQNNIKPLDKNILHTITFASWLVKTGIN